MMKPVQTPSEFHSMMKNVRSWLRTVAKQPYNRFLRPLLPYKIGVYNSVAVRNIRLFDLRDTVPEQKYYSVTSLTEHVSTGDTVVIVGGGLGVSTVVAARRVDAPGNVIVYEAASAFAEKVRETAVLNEVEDRIEIVRAIVGSAIDVWGPTREVTVLDPNDLPECDVLELDCEGAELEILRDLAIRPRVIIVEVHSHIGPSDRDVRTELDSIGYEVVAREIDCKDKTISVLTALRQESESNPEVDDQL